MQCGRGNTDEVLHGVATGNFFRRVTVEAQGEFVRRKKTDDFLASFTQKQQR